MEPKDKKKEMAMKLLDAKSKYALASFDIKTPLWKEEVDFFIPLYEKNKYLDGGWLRFYNDGSVKSDAVENVLRKLRVLFQIERGDFHSEGLKTWDEVFILVSTVMHKTDQFYAVGFVQVLGDEIPVAWVHPILRGTKKFSRLYYDLLTEGRMLLPSPPVSVAMLMSIDKTLKAALSNPDKKMDKAREAFTRYAEEYPDRVHVNQQAFDKRHDKMMWDCLENEANKL